MEGPHKPEDERERLDSLRRLNLLDTPADGRFDRITRLARRSLGTSIALVSLVDGERQWFKSAQGLAATETPREISFCGHAIHSPSAFVVPDARSDPRFADNPLVTGSPDIRLYAGQPIHAPDGYRIGTLCVIDSVPRALTGDEITTLQDLALLVENELRVDALSETERELRERLSDAERRAAIDGLTHVWNRQTINELLRLELVRAARSSMAVSVALVDIDHFKRVNDDHGHLVGDEVLAGVAARLRAAVRLYDAVGRIGGEEFMVVIGGDVGGGALALAERIRARVASSPIEHAEGQVAVTVSVGVCSGVPAEAVEPKSLIDAADRALYAAKHNGRNRVESCSSGDSRRVERSAAES